MLHRLAASYWSLPLLATLLALPSAWLALAIDRSGAATTLRENEWELTPVAEAAQEFASVVVGVNAALLSLYFSITLLVLTIATANLGVRLIDRWLDKRLTRVSLAGLSFNLIFSLVVLAAIDPEATPADLPHATIWALIALETINVAMLAVALNDLGRTIFVDRSIAHLARDAGQNGPEITGVKPYEGDFAETVTASASGYVEGIDIAHLQRELASHPGIVRFCAAPGQHVMEGEPLALLERAGADLRAVQRAIPIGQFRSDGQGAVFEIRLIVEIAARALSPAVNDFYTALTCADRIADAMICHIRLWVEPGCMAAARHAPRFELPGQEFHGLYAKQLSAFRQAAASYPSVTIRMIENLARVRRQTESASLQAYLGMEARNFAGHALERAPFAKDADDIRDALDRFDAQTGGE